MFTRLARVLLAFPLLIVVIQAAPDAQPTKLLRTPTVSATQIAFAYANNIWAVERSGGTRAAADQLPGADHQPALLTRRQAGSPSAASTRATSTSMSCRRRAASRSA